MSSRSRRGRPSPRPLRDDSPRAAEARARRAQAVERRRSIVDGILRDGRLRYPDALPITSRRDELVAAIREHQVIVVAGETGSGKSTQLPKLCIEAGRGVAGLIGHTQPRRVAARTIAERVAEEIGTELGDAVGYTVRFTDRVGDGTLVRVMTDGILLAEIQRDPMLHRYDTVIIDEAHERSLNIDFILGYLRQLLPRRPDLKVIVTSATIDTERFADHFSAAGIEVPVVVVEGRTYPVEVRYRPFGEEPGDDRDQVQAVCDAVDELALEGPGDVLVFVSGEREIRDTADALRQSLVAGTEILPLYARLSSVEQHRIFQPHAGRRIVLSTNVAETSLTVPGVRYVVDAGNARISRYSRRLKVQRLPIEPVSQASANQRAGRCGRVAAGICIRLYSEDDFAARPEFTEPEILRTNLASVILQMTAIGLGDVAAFPFVEPPDAASIRDGYVLLEELGAIGDPRPDDHQRRLTSVGRRLARLPIDPRLGRMVLEADRLGCVRDVMVIASALSIQDPRERPRELLSVANAQHKRFDVAGSDLLSIVALWDHLREQQRALSSNQFRKLCRAEHLNYLRVREWHDLFSQLRRVAGDLGIRVEMTAGHPDHVHRSVLSGLLSHIGMRERDGRTFRGARGARFTIARDSVLSKKPPRWVMAADLVETNQIWARRVATIQPEWAETAGAHLLKHSYGDPTWSAERGAAVVNESVTLYGIPIVSNRTILYDRVDRSGARDMFIQHALVDGAWRSHHAFVKRNRSFVDNVSSLEAKVRRVDLLDECAIFDFYDERIPPSVVSARHFDSWWKKAANDDAHLLDLTEAVLRGDGAIRLADFPDDWRQGDLELPLTYRFDPGGPLDGVTVHMPVAAMEQIRDEDFEWQIPAHRFELVSALVRTLPKEIRRELVPANETVRAAFERLGEPQGSLLERVALVLREVSGAAVAADAFDPTRLPAYLRMNFVVTDQNGAVIDAGTDLAHIRTRVAGAARAAVAAASPISERRGMVSWDVGDIPPFVESMANGVRVRGYPALLDEGDSVALRVFTNPDRQTRAMRGGVRRLLVLTAAPKARNLERSLDSTRRLAIATGPMSLDALAADCVMAAVDAVMQDAGALPWDEESFAALQKHVRGSAGELAAEALRTAADILGAAARVELRLDRLRAPTVERAVADAEQQLARLVRPGFVRLAGTRRLDDVLRYVQALDHRLERLATDVNRDARRMAEVRPLERRYERFLASLGDGAAAPEIVELGWSLEELRVSVFAQSLGARSGISPTRIARELDAIGA